MILRLEVLSTPLFQPGLKKRFPNQRVKDMLADDAVNFF
jgi:hypothetical protein